MFDQMAPIIYEAGAITLQYFKKGLDIQIKDDNSPVTQADTEASDYIINELQKLFPEDDIVSEEHIINPDYTKKVWFIDPLDGTKYFIDGKDKYCIIVSCVDKGRPIIGAIYYPARQELYYAELGKGTWCITPDSKTQLLLSPCSSLPEARLLYKDSTLKLEQTKKIVEGVQCMSKTQDGPYGFVCTELVGGNYDILLLSRANKYECGAMDIIIREAGGFFGRLDGSTLDYTIPGLKFPYPCFGGKTNLLIPLNNVIF